MEPVLMNALVYDRATLEAFAYVIYQVLQGDDVQESAYQMLQDYEFVDGSFEWIWEDEDDA